MDSTDFSLNTTPISGDEPSTTLDSNTNMLKDAVRLNNDFHSVSKAYKSADDMVRTTKRRTKSSLLGIKQMKYNFFNTTSSKVVPIDCLDSDSLEFAKEPIKLTGKLSPSLIENEETEYCNNEVDSLPTIRILNDKESTHSNSSIDKNAQMDSDRNLLCIQPLNNKKSQKQEPKRKKDGK